MQAASSRGFPELLLFPRAMEPRRGSSKRTSSPPRRQRACVPCSRAKARCNFRAENIGAHVCDRCEKLDIDCTKKTTKSLRKPRQIKPLNSRVSSLEKQLEQLTSNLGDSPSSQGPASVSSAPSDRNGSPRSMGTPSSSRQGSISMPANYPSAPDLVAPAAPPNGLSWQEAASILNIFHQQFWFRFPCVSIDDSLTPQQLLAERPFVFRAVMLVAAPISAARLRKMQRNVMAYLSHRLLVEEQRHLDLLQGLLILLAWNNLEWFHDTQITVLTYTALGLAYSLRLARTPLGILQQMGKDQTVDDAHQIKDYAIAHAHSIDEQRAFLGLFCLVSMNSGQFGRRNPLDSQYITVCCDSLASSSNLPSDLYLERLTRMYLIADKIANSFGSPNDNERPQPNLFLVEGHARSIRAELSNTMQGIELEGNRLHHGEMQGHPPSAINLGRCDIYREFFTLIYHYLLVRLYEPASYLHDVPAGQPSQYRSACLRNCLFAAKAFFEARFRFPGSNQIYIPIMGKEHVSFVVTVATRLMFLNKPDWDSAWARTTLDMRVVLDTLLKRATEADAHWKTRLLRFASEMSRAGVHLPDQEANDRVCHLAAVAEKLRFLRRWYEAKMQDVEPEVSVWLRTENTVRLEDLESFGNLDVSGDGMDRMVCTGVPVSAQGEALGLPEPVQSSVTLGMGDVPDAGESFFGCIYSNTPWTYDGAVP